ncbi:MAG: type II toxin-antitoxin system VapC family toxin [Deltaproteobacteria bacterium]|nr:type II toxin-antitoxin system VapC family toxin [Deltaproteobacteria bacterium]
MKKSIVLDCSMTLRWCFKDEANSISDKTLEYVRRHGAIVPSLWGLEVTNGLLQAKKRGRISLDGILEFLELFAKLPIRSLPVTVADCFTTVFPLAQQHNLSSYDASYLYLALRERLFLATCDNSLQSAAKQLGVLWIVK